MYKYGLELKTDLPLESLRRLVRLSNYAQQIAETYSSENPGRMRRVFLFLGTHKKLLWVKREMVKLLTHARFPLLATHKLTRIFNELGLNKDPGKQGAKDPEASIDSIAIHLSAHLGLTPQDVLGGTTIKQAERIYFQLELKRLERQIEASLAHHASPKEYIKSLQREIRKLEQDKKRHEKKRVPNDKKVIDMQEARVEREETNEKKIRNMFKY